MKRYLYIILLLITNILFSEQEVSLQAEKTKVPSRPIIYDETEPKYGTYNTLFSFRARVIETISKLKSVELYINDKKVEAKLKPSGFYEYQVKGSQLGYGIHYYKWVATDAAGRQTTPVGDVIKIASNQIKVDQVGYRTNSKKIFFVTYSDTDNWMGEDEGTPPKSYAKKFKVVNAISKNVVYEGDLTNPQWDENSWDYVQEGDFTAVKTPGVYYISVEKIGDSVWFKIEDDVYSDTAKTLMRSYYLQRCGVYINDKLSGVYHKACHLFDALYFNREDAPSRLWDAGTPNKFNSDGTPAVGISQKVVPLGFLNGGWHDAGDYNKYATSGLFSCAVLLWAYEKMPDKFYDGELDIPESGNGVPDILDEVKVYLDWILKCQIPEGGFGHPSIGLYKDKKEAGAVYHKVSTFDFGEFVPPDNEGLPRYIAGITTTDAGLFAGVMARAARIYAKFYPETAKIYLQAARRAWNWLKTKKENDPKWIGGDEGQQPENMQTGPYVSKAGDVDERFFAAAELYKTTGEKEYENYVLSKYSDENNWKTELGAPRATISAFDWADVHTIGMFTYYETLLNKKELSPEQEEAKKFIEEKLKEYGERILKIYKSEYVYPENHPQGGRKYANRYKIVLLGGYKFKPYHPTKPDHQWPEDNEFVWASNRVIASHGINLIMLYELTKNKEFLDIVEEQLHYVLGRNAVNKSFVTGVGWNYPFKTHHRYVQPTGTMIPGLVVGGPNRDGADYTKPTQLSPIDNIKPAGDYRELTPHPFMRYPCTLTTRGDDIYPDIPKNKDSNYPLLKSYIDEWNAYASNEYAVDYVPGWVFITKYFSQGKQTQTKPKVEIIEPSENSSCLTAGVTIKARVYMNNPVLKVEYKIDDEPWRSMQKVSQDTYEAFFNDTSGVGLKGKVLISDCDIDDVRNRVTDLGGGWLGAYGDAGGSIVNGMDMKGEGGPALFDYKNSRPNSYKRGSVLFSWDFTKFNPSKVPKDSPSGPFAYAGTGFQIAPRPGYYDCRNFSGVSVWIYGREAQPEIGKDAVGNMIRIQLNDFNDFKGPKQEGVEYWGYTVYARPGWNHFVVPFTKFKIPAWATTNNGRANEVLDLDKIQAVEFIALTSDLKGEISIDDVEFYIGHYEPTYEPDIEVQEIKVYTKDNQRISYIPKEQQVSIVAKVVNLNAAKFINVRAVDIKGTIAADQVVIHDARKPVEKVVVALLENDKEIDKKEIELKAVKYVKFDYKPKSEDEGKLKELKVVAYKLQNERIDENNLCLTKLEVK
jgi:endoglucanase